MANMTLSVIINNFNYAAFVGEAIDTALAQTGLATGEAEVVVVDDGSTDNSAQVLSRYVDRARIVFQANGGQASAINTGVRHSKGDILCFLDADDGWAPGKLAAVRQAFQQDPRLSLVYHRLQPVSVDGEAVLKPIPRSLCRGDLRARMGRSAGWWPFPMTSAVAIRRSTWDVAGEIPDQFRISADAWLVGIAPLLGRVEALSESLGFYRLHRNNWYRAEDDAAMMRRRMAHWEATVLATNDFLARRAEPMRLSLTDHFAHRAAAARLEGATPLERLRLAAQGLAFAGEPNLLRRCRDVARLITGLRTDGLSAQVTAPPSPPVIGGQQ